MEKNTLYVDGMSCNHCVNAIKKAVSALPGVSEVSVSLAEKTVTVERDPSKSTVADITGAIEGQGYEVVA
ncbi:MAG: copper ion binding protein [Clostridiales bacterium]|jgi:copper ion binding protein|nr:copper ion binding protein [Clostridiales bacterium]